MSHEKLEVLCEKLEMSCEKLEMSSKLSPWQSSSDQVSNWTNMGIQGWNRTTLYLPRQPSCDEVSLAGPRALPPQRQFQIPHRAAHLLKNLQNHWPPSEPLDGSVADSPKWLLSILVRVPGASEITHTFVRVWHYYFFMVLIGIFGIGSFDTLWGKGYCVHGISFLVGFLFIGPFLTC
jgi:hypothetical protein